VIDDAARDARLNFLRVSMRAAFDAVLLRDVFVFMTVEALSDDAVSDESLAFFDLVVDD
jgi:hypothetical protein